MAEIRRSALTPVLRSLFGSSGVRIPLITGASCRKTVFENLAAARGFSILAGAARASGLDKVLGRPAADTYTLFAPGDAAFRHFPGSALLKDRARLADLVGHHVVPGKVTPAGLARATELRTLGGKALQVGRRGGALTVGGAKILGTGIDSDNGIMYRVDDVIRPRGFAMPHRPRRARLGLLAGLIAALSLGGLAAYLTARKKRAAYPMAGEEREEKYEAAPAAEERMLPEEYVEAPAAEEKRYEEAPMVEERIAEERWYEPSMEKYETRPRVEAPELARPAGKPETARRAAEPAYVQPRIADISEHLDMLLSGDAAQGLNMLMDRGAFEDRQDFIRFLAKAYEENDMDEAMGGKVEPHEARIVDIIHRAGIARELFEHDIRQYLVPLFRAGFAAIYGYRSQEPAMKAT
jgi:uncharacterized surface protein with fasciclin (FAS1) repeats